MLCEISKKILNEVLVYIYSGIGDDSDFCTYYEVNE